MKLFVSSFRKQVSTPNVNSSEGNFLKVLKSRSQILNTSLTGDERLLTNARSTCNFILKDLNRTYDEIGNFAFSYSPLDKSVVFNASLLGSLLLARVYSFTEEKELIEEAKKSVNLI